MSSYFRGLPKKCVVRPKPVTFPIIPRCKDCVFFRDKTCSYFRHRYSKKDSYDVVTDFYNIDVNECRDDPLLCGKYGKYYKEK